MARNEMRKKHKKPDSARPFFVMLQNSDFLHKAMASHEVVLSQEHDDI